MFPFYFQRINGKCTWLVLKIWTQPSDVNWNHLNTKLFIQVLALVGLDNISTLLLFYLLPLYLSESLSHSLYNEKPRRALEGPKNMDFYIF